LGLCSAYGRQLPGSAPVVGSRDYCFPDLLLRKHSSQSYTLSCDSGASPKSGHGVRTIGGSGHHPLGVFGGVPDCRSLVSGRRSDKNSWHRQRCHRVRVSEYIAEFSRRLAVALGRTVSSRRPNQVEQLRGNSGGRSNSGHHGQDLRWKAGRHSQSGVVHKFVTVNTAFDNRRWEYELSTKVTDDLPSLKSLIVDIVDAVRRVNGVLPDLPPEALLVDLGGPNSNAVKLHLTWWTESSRQHQMMASHDRVLTAISEVLKRLAVDDSHDKRPRAA
jgi:hypothetical protein